MSKIEEKREYIQRRMEEGYTRPRIAEMLADEFGISEGYAYTFIYSHFTGAEYKAPPEKRKRPDFSQSKKNREKKGVLDDLASKIGFG